MRPWPSMLILYLSEAKQMATRPMRAMPARYVATGHEAPPAHWVRAVATIGARPPPSTPAIWYPKYLTLRLPCLTSHVLLSTARCDDRLNWPRRRSFCEPSLRLLAYFHFNLSEAVHTSESAIQFPERSFWNEKKLTTSNTTFFPFKEPKADSSCVTQMHPRGHSRSSFEMECRDA